MAFGAEYETALGANWSVTGRADYSYQASRFASIYNTQNDRLNAYDNLNLSLRFARDNGLEVLAYARNLLDQQEVITMQTGTATGGNQRIVFGQDATSYGVVVSQRF